jgi:periplasmic protein TonB
MPLNVRRIFASIFLLVFGFVFTYSQTTAAPSQPTTSPTAADVMRERISKAKAYIVVKNYNAAIYELENIRRETSDPNIHAMLNVLLMHSYLEQTDYKRAQAFLETLHKDLKAGKPNAMTNYYSVAGQIVNGAKTQLERYRSVGLSVADRSLPLEALVDIEKMRETLEIVVEQAKTLSSDKKQTVNALPILEEATNARVALAKDDYDANRWKQSVTDAREMIVNSRSTIINAVDGTTETVQQNTVASNTPTVNSTDIPTATNTKTTETNPVFQPVTTPNTNQKPISDTTKTAEKPVEKPETPKEIKKTDEISKQIETAANNNLKQPTGQPVGEKAQEVKTDNTAKNEETKTSPNTAQAEISKDGSPLAVGSLIEYATKRVNPVYPPTARSVRMTGIVRVDVLIDEAGKVVEVQNTNGPGMLQRAALDAIKKWQFKPFTRDGQPVRAAGFVSFNFSL